MLPPPPLRVAGPPADGVGRALHRRGPVVLRLPPHESQPGRLVLSRGRGAGTVDRFRRGLLLRGLEGREDFRGAGARALGARGVVRDCCCDFGVGSDW